MEDEYIGVIKMFAAKWVPINWRLCDGKLLQIADNNALFSIIGTMYGGDGKTTFALPDLQGRVPVGMGQGQDLSPYQAGQQGGSEKTKLTNTQLPAHNHGAEISDFQVTIKASDQPGTRSVPGTDGATTLAAGTYGRESINNYNSHKPNVNLRTEGKSSANVNVGNTGGSQPFSNVQPYLGINFIICIQGLYPSRQ